jgi:UV DNA damage endonuclease
MPRFGYACISNMTGLTTGHTCRLQAATSDKLRSLIQLNLDSLRAILQHNVAHEWLLFRIASNVIPFGSHPINQLHWWEEFAEPLAEIGRYAREHNIRLSMHPGQYTVLNSPDNAIRAASVAELSYHARFLDCLGPDHEHKLVLHIGAVYGDKLAARDHFVDVANDLPDNVRARLVIENDDRHYTLSDALYVSERTGLPVVYDNLHDVMNPSLQPPAVLLPDVFATWKDVDGPPKTHFSSQAVGERLGKHAELIDVVEFEQILDQNARVGNFDVMVEAKGKDFALYTAFETMRKSAAPLISLS